MFDRKDFESKVALVTGAGRGIGRGIAEALAGLGARVVMNDVASPEPVAGGVAIACDVGDFDAVGAMMARVQRELGGLDFLINNAGIIRDRSIKNMTPAEWDVVLRVNLTGAFNCIKQAQPLLRPGGAIVSLASVSGVMGFFGQANYAASKAGIIALTKVTAREFAKRGIRANAIAPGVVDTEMGRSIPEEVRAQFMQQIPLGRFGAVTDIANAALFLCSTDASYLTGQVLHVNGGFWM